MKNKIILQIFILSFSLFVLQGCYTQIASHKVVYVERTPSALYPINTPRTNPALADSIVYDNPEINEYHYHFYDYDNSCFGGCPDYDFYYSANIYFDFRDHWRPYPRYRYWRYARYYYYDYPFCYSSYYDPYYYDYGRGYYHPWNYYSYRPGYYGHGWNYEDPDYSKREWDRREDSSAGRTIHRGATQAEGASGGSYTPAGNPRVEPAEKSRTIVRNPNSKDRPKRQPEDRPIKRKKTDDRSDSSNKKRQKTVKRQTRSNQPFDFFQAEKKRSSRKKSSSTERTIRSAVAFVSAISEGASSNKGSSSSKSKKDRSSKKRSKNKSSKSSSKRTVRR